MASLWMTVCLAPPVVDVPAAISDAMKPFEMGLGEVSLDRWRWDRWRISCGHGDAGFRIVDGFEHHPGLIGVSEPHDLCQPGWCAGGPRFALDLDAQREEMARQAGAAWDVWRELSLSLSPARRLTDYLTGKDTQRSVNAHRKQPLLQAFFRSEALAPKIIWSYARSILVVEGSDFKDDVTGYLDPVVDFALDRDEYMAWHRKRAERWGGLLTPDGWWWEPGEKPVHNTCVSIDDCPHSKEITDVDDYLRGVPDDTVLVTLVCHC